MKDRRLDAYELSEDFRSAVREAEVTGGRTLVLRDGRPVAAVVSMDEYVALRETVTIAGDEELRARIAGAWQECSAGDFFLPEEILDEQGRFGNDRLRVAGSAARELGAVLARSRQELRAMFVALDDDPAGGVPLFDPMRPLWCRNDGRFRAIYRVGAEGRVLFVLTIDAL